MDNFILFLIILKSFDEKSTLSFRIHKLGVVVI